MKITETTMNAILKVIDRDGFDVGIEEIADKFPDQYSNEQEYIEFQEYIQFLVEEKLETEFNDLMEG